MLGAKTRLSSQNQGTPLSKHTPTSSLQLTRGLVALVAGAAILLAPSLASAQAEAEASPESEASATVSSSSESTEEESEAAEKPSPIKVALSIGTSVGIGSFVSGDQQQVGVATSFSPSISYKLDGGVSLKTGIGGTWYQINDYNTAFENHRFLFSDVYLQASHGTIVNDEDLGLRIGASFKMNLPTSMSSQLQNRLFSITPSMNMTWSFGPVSLSGSLMLSKSFNSNADRSINCETYTDPEQCREGRDADPSASAGSLGNEDGGPGVGGGFESEVRGGEVFIPSAGLTSFYVGYSLSLGWSIIDDLNLSIGAALYHLYGYKSLPKDEYSSEYAKEGRSQTDRLRTSVSLSYQVHKHVGLSLGLATDTVRPFGADGKDLVIFDFSRAPDNITSLSFGINGSL